MPNYQDFLSTKSQLDANHGFVVDHVPSFLYDFQADLVRWALAKGRAAVFCDCGLGKTLIELAWAQAIVERENKPVLLLTPLAVAAQTLREAERFGFDAVRSHDGTMYGARIHIANYERLHLFDAANFIGAECDESSILKNFDGTRRGEITEFMRKLPYRLLATATAAPNDYIELGTSSEALGELGYMDMLGRFFKNEQNVIKPMVYRHRGKNIAAIENGAKWRLKGHAETAFWQWVASWARAARRPSDLGFDDARFVLPPLHEREHLVEARQLADGQLFALPAVGLREERDEMRRSLTERCERVAELTNTDQPALVWCHLNPEGDLLARSIAGAVQVSGRDSDDEKEEKLLAFASGEARVLVSKPKVAGFGLNFQHCAHVTFFPSHSFEQYYQSVRRCWRFGQTRPVVVDIVTTDAGRGIMANLQRKSKQADEMFTRLVRHMNDAIGLARSSEFHTQPTVPSWLSQNNS